MLRYANSAKRKRIAQLASLVAFSVMIPAVFTFITVYKENKINNQIAAFVKTEINSNPSYQLMDEDFDMKTKTLNLNFFNEVSVAEENSLKNRLISDPRYADLTDVKLKIKGSDTKSFDLITTAYKEKRQELQESKNIISGLHKQIEDLQGTITSLNQRIEQNALSKNQKAVAFSGIAQQAKIRYNDIEKLGFANVLSSQNNFIKIDTIPLVLVSWKNTVSDSIIQLKQRELRAWLQTELSLDTLYIKREQ